MIVSVIVGSQRDQSQSLKVACYIIQELQTRDIRCSTVEIADHQIPWYDNEHNPSNCPDIWQDYDSKLKESDAFVIVSPERGGMVPAGLKNFFLWCNKGELAHKPALLVGVSSGLGGSYPIAELRMSSYKNTKICYIPDHLVIRHVDRVLNTPQEADEDDHRIRARISKTLDVLEAYTRAFQTMKKDPCISQDQMPYGM